MTFLLSNVSDLGQSDKNYSEKSKTAILHEDFKVLSVFGWEKNDCVWYKD